MKLKIGDTVIYHKYGTPNGEHLPEPSPAIVTRVNIDGSYNVFVMNPNGCYFNRSEFSHNPEPGKITLKEEN